MKAEVDVAEPDAQGGFARSQCHRDGRHVHYQPPRGRSRTPGRRPSNFSSSSAFPSPVSRSDFEFAASPAALGSRKDADNANSYPPSLSHGVAAATGGHTPESPLN